MRSRVIYHNVAYLRRIEVFDYAKSITYRYRPEKKKWFSKKKTEAYIKESYSDRVFSVEQFFSKEEFSNQYILSDNYDILIKPHAKLIFAGTGSTGMSLSIFADSFDEAKQVANDTVKEMDIQTIVSKEHTYA